MNRDVDLTLVMLWLVALNFGLFGVGTYAAKIWSCAFAWAACIVTALLGRRLFGREAGLLAGCMAAATVGVVRNAVDLRLDSAVAPGRGGPRRGLT